MKKGTKTLQRVGAEIKKYHRFKEITKIQNGPYGEDTDRYNWSMRWYEIIRETLEAWKEQYPNDAAAVEEILGIGNRRTRATAEAVGMKYHMGTGAVYTIRKEFILEIALKAASRGLIRL